MDLRSYLLNNNSVITDLESVKIGDGTNNSLKDVLQQFPSTILVPTVGKTIAHRGLYSSVPENTIEAFEEACKRGFWGIETDIHNTSDGELVCIHDSTVDRTTDGTGTVNNMTYKEIKACTVDAGSNIADYPGLKIPKFEDYLSVCKQYGAVPVIEIKGLANNDIKYYKKMVSMIREYGMEDSCICIGSQDCMEIVRSLSYKIHVQVIVYQATAVTDDLLLQIASLGNAGADFHNSHIELNLVKKCHELGLLVNCWTINDTYMMENYKKLGVNFITSNTYSLGCSLTTKQSQYDASLKTNITGSINEVNNRAKNALTQLGGFSLVALTQAEYDAITTKDANTIYLITG